MRAHRLLPLALLSLGAAACGNAGEDLGVALPGNGALQAQFFVDRDWNGTFNAGDTTIAGLTVYLITGGGRDTVATGQTAATGAVLFTGLVPGPYTVALDSALVLGDSFSTTLNPPRATVANSGQALSILGRVGFPQVTLAQARAAAPGKRLVVLATLTAAPTSFSDSTAHVSDASGKLRLTRIVATAGGPFIPGDIVRVLGHAGSRAGQPVLDSTRVALAGLGPAPVPDTLSTAQAAAAQAGALDAGLVYIHDAEVLASAGQNGDVVLTLDDGSGPLEMRIDKILQPNPSLFFPGDSVNASGVLVSTGAGSWELRLRSAQDLTIF